MNEGDRLTAEKLSRRRREAEANFDATRESFERSLTRLRRVGLALHAHRPSRPRGHVEDRHVRAYADVSAAENTEREGVVVATTAAERTIVEADPHGSGEIDLLRPNEVWAAGSTDKIDVFEARLSPARRAPINELYVPVIGGEITVTLYGPEHTERLGPFRESELARFDEFIWNGRLQIESRSEAKRDGRYIHAVGGLSPRHVWRQSHGNIEVRIPEHLKGEYWLESVRAWPSRQELDFDLAVGGVSGQSIFDAGSDTQLIATITDRTPVSFAELVLEPR